MLMWPFHSAQCYSSYNERMEMRDGGGSPMWYAHVCRGRCNHALSVPMHMEACMLMA